MLFQEADFSKFRLKNRVVMPSIATNLADSNGGVSEAMIRYYAARAKGGAGLIMVENSGIDPGGRNGAIQLRCDHMNYVAGLSRLTAAIHYFGAKALIQLQHAGPAGKTVYTGQMAVGPSPVYDAKGVLQIHELTTEEIAILTEKFASAVEFAQMAGFDGVEIHAAHSYLLAGFISPLCNQRTDEYGGTLANRARFPREVIEATRKRVGQDFLISVRINGLEVEDGSLSTEEAGQLAQILEAAGVDLLNVSSGMRRHSENLSAYFAPGWRLPYAAAIKQRVKIPVIGGGNLRDPAQMEGALAQGMVDLIAVGRPLIADPDWVKKAARGDMRAVNHCLNCNVGCAGNRIFGKKAIQCVVNPDIGREGQGLFAAVQHSATKRVGVIGAGVAGLTAALNAHACGHNVRVWERASRPGGVLPLATVVDGKSGLAAFTEHLLWQAANSGLDIRYNTEATLELIAEFQPDVLIYAGGARVNRLQQIIAENTANVVTAHELLALDKEQLQAQEIIIVGGGIVGCEVADWLDAANRRITLLEMTEHLSAEMQSINRNHLLQRLQEQNVIVKCGCRLIGAENGALVAIGPHGEERLPFDLAVIAVGSSPQLPPWWLAIDRSKIECHVIGDAAGGQSVMSAVHQGTAVGRSLSD